MGGKRKIPAYGAVLYYAVLFALGTYFAFASVQGDYGLFRRIQIKAEAERLIRQRDTLRAEVAEMKNKTRRLSDNFLDLDLLDEQARDVLGMIRSDEIVVR